MDEFLPYFAGFFDGEGSIGIYRNGNTHGGRTLRVQLTQNVTPQANELLLACQTRWGGSLSPMNKRGPRLALNWQASADAGARVLSDLFPWLRLKRTEAEIALAYWEARGSARRDSNGRFLVSTEEQRLAAHTAELALKAAKRQATSFAGRIPALGRSYSAT